MEKTTHFSSVEIESRRLVLVIVINRLLGISYNPISLSLYIQYLLLLRAWGVGLVEGRVELIQMPKLEEAEDIVRQAMSKLSYLETELQNFTAENAELFAGATELLASTGGECPLSWHQCFERYTKQYDDALDNFLRESGLNQEQFADAARIVLDNEAASMQMKFLSSAVV